MFRAALSSLSHSKPHPEHLNFVEPPSFLLRWPCSGNGYKLVEQDIIKKKDKGLTPNSHVKVRDNEAFVNVVYDSDDEDEKNKTNYDNYISQKNMSSDVQIISERSGYASNTEFLYTSMNMATGFILFKGAGTFSGGPRSMQYIIPNRNIHVDNLNLLEESKQSKGK